MKIEYDDFIRTTEPRHAEAVQALFKILKNAGYVYKGVYEGWYDVATETFYKEIELVDHKSPDGNPVRWVQEENWFFKLSAFQEKLLSYIQQNPAFIQPEVRKNEVLSFIEQGLRDVCMSRTNHGWGIPIPEEETKVFYVWFDALINYVAASGWPHPGWEEKWPAEVQWMGKDILTRFHATLWPAMLMGADLPLPKALIAHGWMLMGGEKISKSKGNVIAPLDLAKHLSEKAGCTFEIAVDAVRYYACAGMPYEHDSVFTMEGFEKKYNSDLANDLGNALNRSLAMCHKFSGGMIPDAKIDQEALNAIQKTEKEIQLAMDAFRLDHAAEAAMSLVRFLNKYIDQKAPWALAKNEDPELGAVLRSMILTLQAISTFLSPFVPSTASAMSMQLGLPLVNQLDLAKDPKNAPAGHHLRVASPIFPRIDTRQIPSKIKEDMSPVAKEKKQKDLSLEVEEEIDIQTFATIKLKVGRIIGAEAVEGSNKLLKLQVRVGGHTKQILAGLQKSYVPGALMGKQVVVVSNLRPALLMGHESQGMILAADGPDGQPILVSFEEEVPEGASVH
jgi:methionyl-tRNA synthetase